ncbi:MAG: 3-hydroxyacyl-CoA dehydrogenase, partial [Alphaproteobacteria bacterium]|nr:3-hydroxyacyl-CoA dehydrogenase [Alphaproteobacteria bacterium]
AAQGLVGRIEKSGLPLTRIETKDHRAAIIVDGAVLRLTDGLPATLRGVQDQHALVLYDLCLDYGEAKRIAVAASDKADPSARLAAIGFFQALGFRVSDIDDVPGLVVMRTLAMLVNEAMDAVQARIASPEAIDLAMTKGVNYPRGPLAWGQAVGYAQILAVLDNLARVYGEDRYRASPWLRRVVAAHAAAEAAGSSEEIP